MGPKIKFNKSTFNGSRLMQVTALLCTLKPVKPRIQKWVCQPLLALVPPWQHWKRRVRQWPIQFNSASDFRRSELTCLLMVHDRHF